MKISALHMPVDVCIFRYRPAHEAFVDKRNSISYGKGTSRCNCTAIYRKHCVSYIKQTVVWESVARDDSPICEITQLQYAYCMKHTVVQQRRLWFLCPLQFLLHRRHHCKHRLAFARTLTLLLLLGGDVETNPGPSKQWLKNQADKKTQVKNLSKEKTAVCRYTRTQERIKHPKLSMHPFHNEREQLLRQAMQLIHSQRGMLLKLHMRLTCS